MKSFEFLQVNDTFIDIINSLNEGVNVVDKQGNLIFVNEISAQYVNCTPKGMVGNHISEYYPQAALLEVIDEKTTVFYGKVNHTNGRKYMVKAKPIFVDGELEGGFAIFSDITEVENLNNKIRSLRHKISLKSKNDAFSNIIGSDSSLSSTIEKARKTVGALGGPRHCIITGESGTGKTLLARCIYYYAKEIGVIKPDAPFIEINCAQFTNTDIAAMEIFGCSEGSFTGSKDKKGLFEMANGGILFLDEAHALDNYQNLLLKAIESGTIRRIGGSRDIPINVIVIAASTKNLEEVLLPELYQRLGQYDLYLPPLRERSIDDKIQILIEFINRYEANVYDKYNINLNVMFSDEAKKILLNGYYPRNIRQFRDIVNQSIDCAAPLISNVKDSNLNILVDVQHLPVDSICTSENDKSRNLDDKLKSDPEVIDNIILELRKKGLGPRKIAKVLNKKGIDIKYYQVAYRLKQKGF
ncbi:sigma 54-interacting transcriptional regulator [Clostridium sp. WLY-B-L2]|uniref:Sigma 54-interacting transcriptional regulator n=1 Tax=Clostridium aromativorans TaxID=2836848 RepID=A0ABS8N1N9_9CLOT|nr:sigma 54-interacting transcriptional regulator [Clostridium aromativorans]MCC9293611.1 sigma 54-interacting transcriptional regulator [Clostridium aromativorans]